MGCIFDTIGSKRFIDMEISAHATLTSMLSSHRTRHHRVEALNRIEVEIAKIRQREQEGDDRILWKSSNNRSPRDLIPMERGR